jgi:HSP20 family protein
LFLGRAGQPASRGPVPRDNADEQEERETMATERNVPVSKGAAKAASAPSGGSAGGAVENPLVTLRSEVDRLFDDFVRGWPSLMSFPSRLFSFEPFRRAAEPIGSGFGTLVPKVDVSESDSGYEIEAELPGLEGKDIDVTVSDGVLTIKGQKKLEREEKKKDYYLSERSYGSFQRAFELPSGVDIYKIAASFEKGVLSVSLPKSGEAKAKERKIEIKAKS